MSAPALVDFLLARIAEDEDGARGELSTTAQSALGVQWLDLMRRVLAECEAKRRIVEDHPRCDVHDRPGDLCDACETCGDGSIWPCPTLLHLTAVYADHPDFQEEWRPWT